MKMQPTDFPGVYEPVTNPYTMKKLLIAGSFLLASISLFAQKKETRDVATFTKIGFAGAGKVYVKQGSPQKVELEGSQDILDKYETKVEGDRLSIRPKERWNDWSWGEDDEITVYITVKEVKGLAVAGSGDLITQTQITSDELDLKVSGSGSVKADVVVSGDLEADVSGSGDIQIKGSAASFDSDISGSGDVKASVKITGESSFSIAGSGKIIIDGSSKDLITKISGSGSVKGENFQVEKCSIKVAGSGDVSIHVTEELEVNVAGSGDVRYKGDPKRVNNNSSGSGSVRKI